MIVLAEWVAGDTSIARVVAVPFHLVNTLFLLAALSLTAFWLSGGGRISTRSHPTVWRWVVVGGLAIVLLIYRNRKSVDLDDVAQMKG